MKREEYQIEQSDSFSLNELESCGLIKITRLTDGTIWACKLTALGKNYIMNNPKLKNPSICQDKKWLISTSLAILGIIITIILALI